MNNNEKPTRKRRLPRGVFERPEGSGNLGMRYFDDHGHEHKVMIGTVTAKVAAKIRQSRLAKVAEGRFFPEREKRRNVLLTDAIKDYLKREDGRLRWFDHARRFGRLWTGALGSRALRDVTTGDVDRIVAQRRTGWWP